MVTNQAVTLKCVFHSQVPLNVTGVKWFYFFIEKSNQQYEVLEQYILSLYMISFSFTRWNKDCFLGQICVEKAFFSFSFLMPH